MANDNNRGDQRRVRASERRAKGNNPFMTVSASKRRAQRDVHKGRRAASLASERRENALDQATLTEILAQPTRIVTEDELRKEYSYVLADLRGMLLLAASLIVLLVVLATVLPK